jgi:hypothetical protein
MTITCPQCDQPGVFGYRNKESGAMTWYCTAHRLGQYWADARRDIQANFQCDQPATTSEPPSEPFVHSCEVCGGFAYFGFNVSLRQGQPGQWFCATHRPSHADR